MLIDLSFVRTVNARAKATPKLSPCFSTIISLARNSPAACTYPPTANTTTTVATCRPKITVVSGRVRVKRRSPRVSRIPIQRDDTYTHNTYYFTSYTKHNTMRSITSRTSPITRAFVRFSRRNRAVYSIL